MRLEHSSVDHCRSSSPCRKLLRSEPLAARSSDSKNPGEGGLFYSSARDFCRILQIFRRFLPTFSQHLRRKARLLPSPSLIQLFARSLPVVRMQPIAQRVQPAHRAAVHTLRLLLLLLLCAVLSSSETAPHQRAVLCRAATSVAYGAL